VLFLRSVLAAGTLTLCQSAIAGEILAFEDPNTGSEIYTLKQGSTVARFSPSHGANVYSIEIAGVEYLNTPPDMHDFFSLAFGTPVLYPTPNRVRNSRFTFEGKEYAFKPNLPPDHIHGLVFNEDWEVIGQETTDSHAVVRAMLDFNEGTKLFEKYPFLHRIVLTIEVKEGAVRWTYEVDNTEGISPVPFGFGLHPYFIYQGSRDNTWVTLPVSHKMEAIELFPTGRLIPADELDFAPGKPVSLEGRNFDDVFWGISPTEPTMVDFRDKNRGVTISASESFSHVVLYSPDKDIFSIEHQTSSTDAHNLHAAGKIAEASLQICPPGETRSGWVEYRFPVTGDVEWVFEDEGFKLALQHCDSCHGFAFTGARAKGLWNDGWRHAESPADISGVIANGIPGTEMPAFGDLLDDSQIESLTTLMVELLRKYPREMVNAALEVSHEKPRQSYRETFRLETVVDRVNIPWSFAFLPDNRIILTERDGHLRLVEGGELSAPISGTPRVRSRQDGGLLALALDPDIDENAWIYLSYSDPGDVADTSMTKIIRGRIDDHAWVDEEVVWQAPSSTYTESNAHFGTRLLIDGDHVYFSVGDRGERSRAQDLSSPLGKVHRVHRDGSIPVDNPFRDRPGAYASVWSYGHRNPQGLTLSPGGALLSAEHGPTGGDELNLIEPGNNYGWPLATHGTEMDGSAISKRSSVPGVADPVYVWPETVAPSNIAFYEGEQFPDWRGDLFVASLGSQELRRVEIENGDVVAQELLLKMIGRIRDVQVGPDGFIYLAVERYGGHGSILRLVPATIPSPPMDTGEFRLD
jgi:glucose/arabinose dehydrogenase/galactose mutarotase-like enzyme